MRGTFLLVLFALIFKLRCERNWFESNKVLWHQPISQLHRPTGAPAKVLLFARSPFSSFFLNCLVQKFSHLLLTFCHIIPLDAATLAWSQGDFHYESRASLDAYQRLSVDWVCPTCGVRESGVRGNFDFVQCKMLAICWQAQPLCVDKPTMWRSGRRRRERREAVWREHKFSCC